MSQNNMNTTYTLNTQSKVIIIGYLRKLARNSNLHNQDASVLIIEFYKITLQFHGEEKFANYDHRYFQITDNGLTVRNISTRYVRFGDHTIYLNQWLYTKYIKSATWEFLIHELGTNEYEMSFAVVSRETGVNDGINVVEDGLFGRIINNGIIEYNKISGWVKYMDMDQRQFKKGDSITLTLDLSQKFLSYQINKGKSIFIHNHNYQDSEYQSKYKMAIQLKYSQSLVELTNFVIIYKDYTNQPT